MSRARLALCDTLLLNVHRPRLIDMAEHPEGFALESEQALLVVCSTQVLALKGSSTQPVCLLAHLQHARRLASSVQHLTCLHFSSTNRGWCQISSLVLQGDGVPPIEAREFCDWLSGSSAPKLDHTHFSVCALGDT